MNVLVNGTTLNGKAYAERDNGMIICTVIVPQTEKDYANVKALFKGNTEDIIYTKEDGSTELFSGFTYKNTVDDDENGQYIVKLTSDEHSFQLGRNRQLEADKATLESTVASKDNEISTLTTSITEKDGTITEQGEKIVELEATIVSKDAEIAELLTIAEEYADMVFASLEEYEIEDLESEVM